MEESHQHEHEHEHEEHEDLFGQLGHFIPPEIKKLPKEAQEKYLRHWIEQFQKNHEEEIKKEAELHAKYREVVQKNYIPKHSYLYDISKWKFTSGFVNAALEGTMRSYIKQVHPGVYAFPMLEQDFCSDFLEELDHFEKWSVAHNLKVHRPNSMNNYGAILDDFGFSKTLDTLMKTYIEPISQIVFPYILDLDDHHGFIVSYELGKDTNLDFHVDDAEVTLNVCLGKEFTGGDLYFGGVRCDKHQNSRPRKEEEFNYVHKRGIAILHVGKHRHAATHILSGERHNLILWMKSSAFRKQEKANYGTEEKEQHDNHGAGCGCGNTISQICPKWCDN